MCEALYMAGARDFPACRRITRTLHARCAAVTATFGCRLEGFNEDWVETGTSRRAEYSRLSAGKCRFVVKACNNAGVWNDAGAALGFVVSPFFWQTWWFRLTTLGAFTLSLIAMVRYVSFRRLPLHQRLPAPEQHRALERERVRLAQALH